MDVQVTLWQVCIFKCRDGIGKYKVEDEMRQLCKVCNLLFVSLYFCLSLVYSLKCACKCFCNLNKRAISEIFFLQLVPNSEHQDIILLCISVPQYYC